MAKVDKIEFDKVKNNPQILKLAIHIDKYQKIVNAIEEYMNMLMITVVEEFPNIETDNKNLDQLLVENKENDELYEKLQQIKEIENLLDSLAL